jgi:hypothetical protein
MAGGEFIVRTPGGSRRGSYKGEGEQAECGRICIWLIMFYPFDFECSEAVHNSNDTTEILRQIVKVKSLHMADDGIGFMSRE